MPWKKDLAKLKQDLVKEDPAPAKATPPPKVAPKTPVSKCIEEEDAIFLSAMGLPQLPPEMLPRLNELFASVFKPDADNAGFNYLKYPDNNFLAYGLIERKTPAARPFVEAVTRDCIRGGEFAETLEIDEGGKLIAGGVMPSLFNPLNLIEFTWLLNGVRYDSGLPAAYSLPAVRH